MIDNLAKVYLNENGSIKNFEDTAFLVSNADKANSIQFYVPDSMNTSLVQLSFKRADDFVISNRQMELITVLDPASGADVEVLTKLYEYQFTESDRILDIAGQLQVSAVLKDGSKTVATPYFCLYIRRNIQPNLETKTEEEFYQEGLSIVEQAQIDINNHRADFNNPHRVRGDQVPLSNQNTTLITDKLSEIDESIRTSNTNITNLQQKDIELEQTIEQNKRDATSYTDSTANALQEEINFLNSSISTLENNKLNKIFNDIAIANNLAENDYFVLNSGNQVYRITVENMKKVFGGGGGSDHYKGDFISYEELVETYPTAKAGDYAFVNIGSQMIMYVWDSTGEDETMQGLWRETTSGKYVLTTTFANFQEMLLNGSLIVDTAKNFDNGDGTKTNIKESFEIILENYRNLSEKEFVVIEIDATNPVMTQEIYDLAKNNDRVMVKITNFIPNTAWYAYKNSFVQSNTSINFIAFSLLSLGYTMFSITENLEFNIQDHTDFALASTLNLRLGTNESDKNILYCSISNSDNATEKNVDLSPVIQQVIDDSVNNDLLYVFDNIGWYSNENEQSAKVKELINANEEHKIVVKYNNKLYFFERKSNLSTKTELIFISNKVGVSQLSITQEEFIINLNLTTNQLSPSSSMVQFFLPTASDVQIETGTSTTTIVTPKGLKTYVDSLSFDYIVPTVYIIDSTLEYGTFEGLDLTNLQDDPNTIIYQPNTDGTNDAYTILGETAGTRTFGNFKGNMVYKIEVNLADGTWNKTNTDIVTQSELNSTIGDINSILDSINGEVI